MKNVNKDTMNDYMSIMETTTAEKILDWGRNQITIEAPIKFIVGLVMQVKTIKTETIPEEGIKFGKPDEEIVGFTPLERVGALCQVDRFSDVGRDQDAFIAQDYLPEKLKGQVFYRPSGRGYEKIVKERLEKWRQLKQKQKEAKKDL